jgi:subtilisin family serine protease
MITARLARVSIGTLHFMNMVENKFWRLVRLAPVFILILALGSRHALGQSKQRTLLEIDRDYHALQQDAETRIVAYLKKSSESRLTIFENGKVRLLTDVTTSGVPIYTQTYNAQVATSLNIPQLRTGGSLGINILGTGITIATWDGGKVRSDHVELAGRVTQMDNSPTLNDHATHTSGTMIASGVNSLTKGMAPEANLKAFDFSNDVSEMAANAASLILSNHSYGTASGWESDGTWHGDPAVSTTIDYKFGFYDAAAASWDGIAFNAPKYLIVKAAGNDRGESGSGGAQPDGGTSGFDCIPTYGVAKNILTVGAVAKLISPYSGPNSVTITSFSSWGPTDDGRIKPDLVAPGLNVLSCTSGTTTEYQSFSGTSMAAPAVTGTMALLQQLYKSLNSGQYMRSATAKALAIHTAREAGLNPGPDYAFGWGLLDAEAAAKLIINKDNQNIFIREQVLLNGQTFEMDLGTPKAGTKVTATIVWTDPAGTPVSASVNPTTLMLVNDLDLRLVDDGGTQTMPWTLNPASPSAAAVTADNIRDNVEKIELASPLARNYKLRVTNKGTLVGGQQAFSLILTYSSQIDPRTAYYWRPVDATLPSAIHSGGGKWTDGAHWSLTSGGPAANAVPGPDDRVVFDENSFAGDTDTITVKLPANVSNYSLRWFAKEAVDFNMGGNNLTLAEDMTLLTNNITTSTVGTVNFVSTNVNSNSIDIGSNVLSKWTFNFNGNSSWTLTGTGSVDKVILTQGKMTFSGSTVHLNQLSQTGVSTKTVAFQTSSVQALQNMAVDFSGMTVESDALSSITIMPTVTNTINVGAAGFPGLINMQGGDVTISGSSTVRSIQGNGIVRLTGGFTVSNLSLSGGSQLILQQGTTQTFTDKFQFSTSATNRVAIKSSGTNASLAFDNYYKVCVDNVDITNVDVVGTSIVSSGAGSTVVNSQKWIKAACSSVLFPDFAITYSCVKSSTYFTDKSSGPITARSWNFGDTGSGTQNTSTLTSPLHYYAGGGPFTVTLTLNGASTITKTVTLAANSLPDNTIQLNNGKLISSQLANGYQWLLGGQIVSGETQRSYTFATPGDYSVLIFDATCNKKSDPLVITGVDEVAPIAIHTVKIYPNPTSDFLQIESTSEVVGVSVMDAVGRESRIEPEPFDGGRYRLNVSVIPNGLYILRVATKDGRVDLQKVIIRK